MDPQDFGFLDPHPDPQKYARGNISAKNCKKKPFILLNPKSELLRKKEIIRISSSLNDSSSFRIKNAKKNKTRNLKLFFVKKIQ